MFKLHMTSRETLALSALSVEVEHTIVAVPTMDFLLFTTNIDFGAKFHFLH